MKKEDFLETALLLNEKVDMLIKLETLKTKPATRRRMAEKLRDEDIPAFEAEFTRQKKGLSKPLQGAMTKRILSWKRLVAGK